MAEARLLTMLDFAGEVSDVLSQPLRLRFDSKTATAEHIPDFLAETATGTWLIDVRPAGRIKPRDELAFAATAQLATAMAWGYVVVTGWMEPAMSTVDALSAQRRFVADLSGIALTLTSTVNSRSAMFGELAQKTHAPSLARALLLHMLWNRELSMDLTQPLSDRTVVRASAGGVTACST